MGLLSAQSVFVCFSVSWQLQIWEGRNCPFANVEMLNLDEEYSCYFSLRDGNWVFELQNPFCRNGTHWLRSGLSWQQRKRDKMTWERAWSHFLCGPRLSQVARAICLSILWELLPVILVFIHRVDVESVDHSFVPTWRNLYSLIK
jgi:hypothetical protein